MRHKNFSVPRLRSEICEIKIPRNMFIYLNRKIKMPQKVSWPNHEVKMPRKIPLKTHLSKNNAICYFGIFVVYLLYHIRLIRLSGDIELNPGPKPSSFKCFSICHWNLNSITSHDFWKVKHLTAYNVIKQIWYHLHLLIIS